MIKRYFPVVWVTCIFLDYSDSFDLRQHPNVNVLVRYATKNHVYIYKTSTNFWGYVIPLPYISECLI